MTGDGTHQAMVDGVEVEYVDQGVGDPFLLIHAGVFGAWFTPLVSSGTLDGRVVSMRRAGYTSGPPPAQHLSIGDHARHAAALLEQLDLAHVHVVAHSSGCLIALQLAADRPSAVRSLVLYEPSLGGDLTPPSFEAVGHDVIGPAMAAAAVGDVPRAFDTFMCGICAPDYRSVMEASLGPDSLQRAVRDAQYFFADEVPAVQEWVFTPVEAARIDQPVLLALGSSSPAPVHDVGARLAALLPQTETVVHPGGDHLLPLRDPVAFGRLANGFARPGRPLSGSDTGSRS